MIGSLCCLIVVGWSDFRTTATNVYFFPLEIHGKRRKLSEAWTPEAWSTESVLCANTSISQLADSFWIPNTYTFNINAKSEYIHFLIFPEKARKLSTLDIAAILISIGITLFFMIAIGFLLWRARKKVKGSEKRQRARTISQSSAQVSGFVPIWR